MQLPGWDKHHFISRDHRRLLQFQSSWQWAGPQADPEVQTQNRQANASGMPPVWDFVFSPSLAWCFDGRALLLHILNICDVFLEQWLSVRTGCVPAAPECHWFGSTTTFSISSSAAFRPYILVKYWRILSLDVVSSHFYYARQDLSTKYYFQDTFSRWFYTFGERIKNHICSSALWNQDLKHRLN